MKKFNIAIDGPAGAGKSTIARLVADNLGFIYVDTGAMYRAVTWKIIQSGIRLDDEQEMIELAKQSEIRLLPGEQGQLVFIDGKDVTSDIRSAEVTGNVSQVAQVAGIRKVLVAKQKEMAASKGVVMDGRDIGSTVLPDAEVKVFLTASVSIRAERRFKELKDAGRTGISLEQLERDIAARDKMDQERETSPLVRAEGAVLLDTTEMTIPEVVESILSLCREHAGGGK
ncbi:(d)CMP kinase [Paenibacillus hamazuiensis]|uniref:(d)CMP kinase n=1 Tax=Paenibacillus hamazuiensis TaxID=2936508 RepID=UPI0020101585|nr:(d)CMP kinase [Paenibacillus hamazuiensis]